MGSEMCIRDSSCACASCANVFNSRIHRFWYTTSLLHFTLAKLVRILSSHRWCWVLPALHNIIIYKLKFQCVLHYSRPYPHLSGGTPAVDLCGLVLAIDPAATSSGAFVVRSPSPLSSLPACGTSSPEEFSSSSSL